MDSVSRGAAWTINHGDAVAISSVFKQTKILFLFSYISHYFRTPAEADAPNKRPTHRLHDFLMKAIGKLLQKFVSPEQRKVKIDLCL